MTHNASRSGLLDEDAVVELTRTLVRMRTVNDPNGPMEAPAAAHLAELMRGFGWSVTVTEVAPGRPNVIATINGDSPGRTLMFIGHTDVVTEGDPAKWSFDPFAGDIVDGRLRGRGAADMKSGVAAMIYAARAVELAGFDGRILLGAFADEEGMMLGSKAFAAGEESRSGIDGVIVCEPEGGEICAVAKGAIRVRIELVGVMAHGAMPEQGRNPLPAMGSLLLGIGELQAAVADTVDEHEHLGRLYITPTMLTAGMQSQLNVIPATAAVGLDIRTIPGIAHPALLHLITRLAEQIAAESELTARVIVIDDRPPVETAADSPVVRALLAAHEKVTGEAGVLGGVPGTTDGTILTRDAGLETVVYGPGGKWIAHQVDEFVAVQDILTCARVYVEAATLFLGEPGAGAPAWGNGSPDVGAPNLGAPDAAVSEGNPGPANTNGAPHSGASK